MERIPDIRLFRFHTWLGSGPKPLPVLDIAFIVLGAVAWWPLADLATSRGRGAGGAAVPEGFPAADEATTISLTGLI